MRRSAWVTGATMLRLMVLALSCGVLLHAGEAQAILGASADTVVADQIRFKGEHRQSTGQRMNTHEISLPDGSSIKEYVNSAGLVFAVSWRTRLKPDLEKLLGTNFVVYAAKQRAATGLAESKRQQTVRQPNLVVRQAGRMNAFAGLAYVPALVPVGIDADALR